MENLKIDVFLSVLDYFLIAETQYLTHTTLRSKVYFGSQFAKVSFSAGSKAG